MIITGKNEKARTRLKLFEWIVKRSRSRTEFYPNTITVKDRSDLLGE
ncbi:MAG: hypothetical protein O4861_12325 [Trichodesmium sp. St16_bin4-tuft]|nr:hypothetical protein [Trichodesmium sp. MAG_R01]MDE5069938.1 hypothetical protein [Trichodesmium sp. St4_bin8_1]MDE5077669.1 hypothetical protein [Trichodesmium sp. St2_bin6]MDE5091725.1 hypothetical protein [Trichodesmium sp. St18_bin3_1_1]MDE5099073.1 hypothetical protein [Trichodesmium sp. St16_bin4-tuft]MDE5103001.1 hypothetical protein [Trichodesmium sp. St19_bin2]